MLKIQNLYIDNLLEDINLTFEKGKITTIIGENGVGKSTLTKCITKLVEYKGKITYEGREDFYAGYIFQNPDNQFVRNIVIDDIAFSLESLNISKEQMEEKILKIAEKFEIKDLLYQFTSELSGGQKQKVAIVANLVLNPQILILDEAFEMIDEKSTKKIKELLLNYVKENDIVCIQISHDINAIDTSDNIIVLENKKVIFNGNINQFYKEDQILKKLNLDLPLYTKLSKDLNLNIKTEQQMKRVLCNLNLKK